MFAQLTIHYAYTAVSLGFECTTGANTEDIPFHPQRQPFVPRPDRVLMWDTDARRGVQRVKPRRLGRRGGQLGGQIVAHGNDRFQCYVSPCEGPFGVLAVCRT